MPHVSDLKTVWSNPRLAYYETENELTFFNQNNAKTLNRPTSLIPTSYDTKSQSFLWIDQLDGLQKLSVNLDDLLPTKVKIDSPTPLSISSTWHDYFIAGFTEQSSPGSVSLFHNY